MEARVHAAAHVDPGAELADDVDVRAGAVIEAGVRVGAGSVINIGTVLHAGTVVGVGCRVGPYAVIGGDPMDTTFEGEPSGVLLEDGVDVREFATVHRATGEGMSTRVGARTLVMAYVHVSHNDDIGADCVLTNGVQLGGHVEIGDGAVVGAASLVHQHCRIGRGAMFGAGSGTNRDVLPFTMARGAPARHFRLNRVGLLRRGVQGERYTALEQALRAFRRRDRDTVAHLATLHDDVATMEAFAKASRRGVARFLAER
ncbi:acyl-ACP--UDP-N-acetylglucosamine O-acyltransferase [soil metagenome]|nr:acyl-ACP--UDP-N-acetylglucosamine O-acyltransferase [Trueperaceae bacterium]